MFDKFPFARCRILWACSVMVVSPLFCGCGAEPPPSRTEPYRGCCSASAVVALDDNHFAVGNDEDNVLRIYRRDQAGLPEAVQNLKKFLAVDKKSGEADLEGAARLGGRIYWIGSHGRNPDGKSRPERRVLFATDIIRAETGFTLEPFGVPYRRLIHDLMSDARYAPFRLKEAERLAPKESGGLNIEGLCATPDNHLLIGFRNPLPQGRALLAPLLNPEEVMQGRQGAFGDPVLIDLLGQGVRDIAYGDGKYFIIAGSYHGGGNSVLYEWAGAGSVPKALPVMLPHHFNAEAVTVYPSPNKTRLQILSDDGNQRMGGDRCKDEKNPSNRLFRSLWLEF